MQALLKRQQLSQQSRISRNFRMSLSPGDEKSENGNNVYLPPASGDPSWG